MFFKIVKQICPGGGMVDTLVLEANVERRASSSLAWGTINWKHWQVSFMDA